MASSQYNFKLIDFHVSRTGYFLKVAMLAPSSSSYRLVYIPYSKYPSLLMLEYLVASQKEMPAELSEALAESVRQDLAADVGIVILANPDQRGGIHIESQSAATPEQREGQTAFDLQGGSRPSERAGEALDEGVEAARTRAGGFIEDQMTEGERPIEQDTRIFREVHLSKNVTRDLAKLKFSDLAYRIKDQELYIDRAQPARRISSNEMTVARESFQAKRPTEKGLTVMREEAAARREDASFQAAILREQSRGERSIHLNPLHIEREWVGGYIPERVLRMQILRGVLQGEKGNNTALHIERTLLWAERAWGRRSWIHQVLQSQKRLDRPMHIHQEMIRAKIAAKQYPALLFKITEAEKRVDRSMHLHLDQLRSTKYKDRYIHRHDMLYGQREYQSSRLYILRQMAQGPKLVTPPGARPVILHREHMLGRRSAEWDLFIDKNYGLADRDKESGAWIMREHTEGSRPNGKELDVLKAAPEGTRDHSGSLHIPKEMNQASTAQRGLYLPRNHYQGQKADKEMYLDYVREAQRKHERPTHLDTVVSSRMKEKESVLDEIPFAGEGAAYSSELHDALVSHLNNIREGRPFEELVGGIRQSAGEGTFIEDMILSNALREYPATFLDVIFGHKEFPAELMDEVLVGVRDNLSPSVLENLAFIVGQEEAHPGHIEEFLAGAKIRLQGLISSGILGYQKASPSILTFGIEGSDVMRPADLPQGILAEQPGKSAVVGEEALAQEVFRPTEFHVENPLGYFEPDASFLPEETLSDRLQDGGVLDSLQQPLGSRSEEHAAAMGDSLEGFVRERIAELSSEYIFGQTEARASSIADIYFLGQAGIRDGMIPEEDFDQFAKLAVEQAIIGEAMFATNPEKAGELFESIMAFKGIDRSAYIEGDHTEADRPSSHEGTWVEEYDWATRDIDAPAFLDGGHEFASPVMNPAEIYSEVIAQKRDDAAQILENLLGDRELAEAVVTDYLLSASNRRDHSGHLMTEPPLTGAEQLRQAFLDKIDEMGQGLIYDYTNDSEVLDAGMDPEYWEGGFGVPEEYDPDDPFNDYFPWTDERTSLEMGQDDWIRFDSEEVSLWHRDRDLGEFYCDAENQGVTGYYRNDFSHEDYLFEVSFKVYDSTDDDGAGIIFRYTDPANYYMFMVHGGDMEGNLRQSKPMQLYRVVGGDTQQMGAPMNPFTWELGKWYQLRVSVVGNRIRLSVNGRLQYDFTD
ncbi:family 16 glycoside hydrolase (plasmid) [Paenibacillus sp. S-38]|uniref:family 16 glycoside hydrolase n=1 Tax=Paenibacillus sp. S-38 TaxID=3416710 RepID=UPI003CFB41A7